MTRSLPTDLQERIAMADNLDGNAAEALKLLLESTPIAMTTGLEDWTLEEVNVHCGNIGVVDHNWRCYSMRNNSNFPTCQVWDQMGLA